MQRSRLRHAATLLLAVVGLAAATVWFVTRTTPPTSVVGAGGTTTTCATTTTTDTTTTASTTTSTAPAGTTTTAAVSTTTVPAGPEPLRQGASGPAVRALQERLLALGYWLTAADGTFGPATTHAVVAFQKTHRLARDGVVGPATARALAEATRPAPRSSAGRLVEIELARQLLLVVADGRVQWVMDTSTGRVRGTTPIGHFRVTRQIDGYHRSPLGVLYRPKYFSGGVAIHGYPSVPPYPASHGCVRLTNAAMDWLWANDALPIGTPVWVY